MRFLQGKKQAYVLILLLLALALAVVIVWKAYSPSRTAVNDIPLVRTQVVRIDNGSETYKYAGEVRGRYESPLAFRVGGKVIKRNVNPGSSVKAGDLLMQVDPSDMQLTVNTSEAQVNSTRLQLKLARDTLDRSRSLYEQGAISKAEYERVQNAYDTAQALCDQVSAQSQQTVNHLEYCSLYADSAGTITDVNAQVGQVVAAGAPVLTLIQEGEREVEISVPENRIEKFRNAKQIKVSLWAIPNINLDGQVREVASMADPVARTFKVRITLLNPPPEIKLGMTAEVLVSGNGYGQSAAVIPLAAIYQTGDVPAVWVVNKDTVSLRKIKIASFANDQVQVSEGLKDGDTVVTAGVHKLQAGQKVRTGKTSI